MALITPEYRELQQKLHATGKYGLGGSCKDSVNALAQCGAKEGESILDYGCGNGQLKQGIGHLFDVREYDPCIDGKDGPPESADYVISNDVLEHIEPDCLEHVLGHIQTLAKKRAILIISTREATKTLEDGRNAHLIVQDPEWWLRQLNRFFRIEGQAQSEDRVLFVCDPMRALPMLKSIGVMSDDERNEFVKRNVGATWKRIPDAPVPAHDKFLIICCYGPSIADTWQEIAPLKKQLGAEVVSVSGAHDFLWKKGIRPDYHIECDPRLHKSDMIKRPLRKTKYLMASCCHPDFIKRFAKHDLTLWHLFNGEPSYKIRDIPSERMAAMIPGGGSVGLRTMVLFYYLGYRNFIVHGFDCSYREVAAPIVEDGKVIKDGEYQTHAGAHSQTKKPKTILIKCGQDSNRWFGTAPVMVSYAQHMLNDIRDRRYPNTQFYFMGDGLFQDMLKAYLAEPKIPATEPARDYFSMRPEDARPDEKWNTQENAA